jgi:rubrerythrin
MAQKIVSIRSKLDHYSVLREAVSSLSASDKGLQRSVWTCDVCGMIHLTGRPLVCESCANPHAFSLQADTSSEMHPRA